MHLLSGALHHRAPSLNVKIHREGTNILILLFLVLTALNVPVWLFMPPVVIPLVFTVASAVVYLFVFNFFRSPKRTYRGDRRDHVVSSVDGHVVAIERVREDEYIGGDALMLSVFMSPLNVHANWYPVDGTVEYVRHRRGRFLSAYLPKASSENERCTIGMVMDNGRRIAARQVGAAHGALEDGVAHEGEAVAEEHDAALGVAGRLDDLERHVTHAHLVALVEQPVGGGRIVVVGDAEGSGGA